VLVLCGLAALLLCVRALRRRALLVAACFAVLCAARALWPRFVGRYRV